jgi:hypothetical protein
MPFMFGKKKILSEKKFNVFMFGKKKSVYLKKERCLKKSWEKRYDFFFKKNLFHESSKKNYIFFFGMISILYLIFNSMHLYSVKKRIVFIYVLVKK